MKRSNFIIITILAIVLALFCSWIFINFKKSKFHSARIIYGSTEPDEEIMAKWKDDCAKRKGQFNSCGSACEDPADGCIAVCAYTCEKIPQN